MAETEANPFRTLPGRNPVDDDLEPLLDLIFEGDSLRTACRKMGLHTPRTSVWLNADKSRAEQYRVAREGRKEAMEDKGLVLAEAAALGKRVDGQKVDPAGVRAYNDHAKWVIARMEPKVQRLQINHTFGALDDDALEAEIKRAEREAAGLEGEEDG